MITATLTCHADKAHAEARKRAAATGETWIVTRRAGQRRNVYGVRQPRSCADVQRFIATGHVLDGAYLPEPQSEDNHR